MKLTIDTDKKTIQVNGVALGELVEALELIGDFDDYILVSEKEVVSYPTYIPYNPYPWYTQPRYDAIPCKVTCNPQTTGGATLKTILTAGDTVEVINTKGESEGEVKITSGYHQVVGPTGYSSPIGSTGTNVKGPLNGNISWTATTWCTKEPNYDLEDE